MKKRNQKLSLNRETVVRLESLPAAQMNQIAGGLAAVGDAVGGHSSCGRECGCPEL